MFDLIAADVAVHYGGHPNYYRRTNHTIWGANFWQDYNKTKTDTVACWQTPYQAKLYPPLEGNFAGQDGHGQHIRIAGGSAADTDNTTVGNQFVPRSFEVSR